MMVPGDQVGAKRCGTHCSDASAIADQERALRRPRRTRARVFDGRTSGEQKAGQIRAVRKKLPRAWGGHAWIDAKIVVSGRSRCRVVNRTAAKNTIGRRDYPPEQGTGG